jgi:hypothetical protein
MEVPPNKTNQLSLEEIRELIMQLESIKNHVLNGRNKKASSDLSNAIKNAEQIKI